MAKTIDGNLKRKREQQARQRERQRAKAIARSKDPAYREEQFKKKVAQADKAREKQEAKRACPKYQEEQLKKKIQQQERQLQWAKNKSKSKSTRSRGLKGRTPNAEERRIMDALGQLPCIACHNLGRHTPLISLHHNDGRTKPYAHANSLPLCAHHHDTPVSIEVLEKYPDLIPIHARGILGGKTQWRQFHGHERDLLKQCYEMAGITMPEPLFILLFNSE